VAQADWLGPKVDSRLVLTLFSPNELSQWQWHDDSTINIVFCYYYYCYQQN